jgi:hypothetical protein
MNLFKWLFCAHEYRISFFHAPHRDILNLTCEHCGKELIFPLIKGVI